MSSIISDIFFNNGNGNNHLIDHYLLEGRAGKEGQSQYGFGSSKQGKFNDKGKRSGQLGESISRIGVDHSMSVVGLGPTLLFNLTINITNSTRATKTPHPHTLLLQLGPHKISQTLTPSDNLLSTQLALTPSLQDIHTHNTINITVSEIKNNEMVSMVGCCYLPVVNVRNMLGTGVGEKGFVLWMRDMRSGGQGDAGKYKVECEVVIDGKDRSRISRAQEKVSSREWKQASHTEQKPKWQKSRPKDKPRIKNSSHYSSSQPQRKQLPSYLQSNTPMSHTSHLSANETQSNILKFQLENKPTRISIQHYKPKTPSALVSSQYQFVILGKKIQIGEQIVICSADIDKKGIIGTVMKGETSVGVFHLNIVLLLGGCVEGLFPVCEAEAGECVGTVKLGSAERNGKEKDVERQEIVKCKQEESKEDIEQECKWGFVLTVQKLLFMPKNSIQPLNIHEQSPHILIRFYQTIKIQKNCKIQLQKQQTSSQIYTIIIQEPIIIEGNDKKEEKQNIEMEMEVYIRGVLVGYGRMGLPVAGDDEVNRVSYGGLVDNLTTDDWLCSCIVNYMHFRIDPTYFPASHYQKSLKSLSIPALLPTSPSKTPTTPQNIHNTLKTSILEHNPTMIYSQAHRITDLLFQALISENYHYISSTILKNFQWKNKGQLMEQLEFLDERGLGWVRGGDLKEVIQYYGIASGVCDQYRQGLWNGAAKERADQVLYLFLLAGVRIEARQYQLPQIVQQNVQVSPQKDKPQHEKNDQPLQQVVSSPQQLQPLAPDTPSLHIDTLSFTNLHTLMPGHTIPSLRVSFPAQGYTTRPFYSCANPVVRLGRRVRVGEWVVLGHWSVREGTGREIGRFRVQGQGKREYRLGGQAKVKILIAQ